jgi:hypothetical protein
LVELTSGASDELLIDRTSVTSVSFTADGGDIRVNAGGSPIIMRDSLLAASARAGGDGGNVVINNAGQTILQRSQILAKAEGGNGGDITISLINGEIFIQDSESILSADSQLGINGQITINSLDTDLNSQIQPKDVDVSRPPELGTNACAPARSGDRSTFVRAGRGGVAEKPDGYLTAMPAGASEDAKRAGIDIEASGPASSIIRTASTDTVAVASLGEGCL